MRELSGLHEAKTFDIQSMGRLVKFLFLIYLTWILILVMDAPGFLLVFYPNKNVFKALGCATKRNLCVPRRARVWCGCVDLMHGGAVQSISKNTTPLITLASYGLWLFPFKKSEFAVFSFLLLYGAFWVL